MARGNDHRSPGLYNPARMQRRTDRDGQRLYGIEVSPDEIGPWHATIAGLRDAGLAYRVTGMNFFQESNLRPEGRVFMPTQREVETTSDMFREAVVAGRLIDFGHLPNEVIKAGGKRGGLLYEQGALGHPFREPWVFVHTWDETMDGRFAVCCYLVNPLPEPGAKAIQCDAEVSDLQPVMAKDTPVLMIGDRAMITIESERPEGEPVDSKYAAVAAPSPWRFLRGFVDDLKPNLDTMRAAVSNVIDPLVTALLILNTRNIDRETIRVSEKLQRARAKNGKPLIPPYDRVNSAPYVTAVMARGQPRVRGENQGGTHASPITHIRQGHWRAYPDHRTFIGDTLVNASEEIRAAFKSSRSHYAVRGE